MQKKKKSQKVNLKISIPGEGKVTVGPGAIPNTKKSPVKTNFPEIIRQAERIVSEQVFLREPQRETYGE